MYLDDVYRLLCIFLKQQHGGSVGVNVELSQELSVVCCTLIYVAKAYVVSKGKCCQLKKDKENLEKNDV